MKKNDCIVPRESQRISKADYDRAVKPYMDGTKNILDCEVPPPRPLKKVHHDSGLPIFHASMETTNFIFTVIGHSEQQCVDALRTAWKKHQRQTGATDPFEFYSISLTEMKAGVVHRDGEPMK